MQTDPFGLKLTYGYDKAGNVTSVQDSVGGVVNSTYDPANQLLSRTLSGTGVIPLRLDFTYTPDGQVATITRYKDLAGTQKVGTSSFSYDPAGNLLEVKHQNASGSTLGDYSYAYDAADELLTEWNNGTATNYRYDPAGQLVGAGSASYSYDPNGNRTLPGYQTGTGNELLSDGTWNYTYDAAGNVVTKTNIATGNVWTYGYDLNNNLTSAVEKDKNGTVLQSVTLKYDVFGQLVEENTTVNGSTTVQRFAFDAEGNVWADLDGNNNLVARRLYAEIDGQTQAVARESYSGGSATAAAWYLSDHLGSVRDIEDNASGAVIDHLDYDAYGNLTDETQPGNGDRFKHAQGAWDATLSLYHFGARWYDPASGRWEEQDPLGLGPDSNDYRYVGNGPTNYDDPSGTDRIQYTARGKGIDLYYVRRHHTIVGGYDAAPVYIGTLDPASELVQRDGKFVSLVNVEKEVDSWFYTTSDWGQWFKDHAISEDELKGWLNTEKTMLGVPNILNEKAAGLGYAKGLVKDYMWQWATAGFNVGGSRFLFRGGKWWNMTKGAKATDAEVAAVEREAQARLVAPAGRWQPVNEAMSARARAYQTQVTGRTGEAYVVNGVRIDGVNGATLLKAKGPGYATFVRNGRFQRFFKGRDALLDQARRQVAAANGAPITWHFAEADAVTAMRNLLADNNITGINIVHTPVAP